MNTQGYIFSWIIIVILQIGRHVVGWRGCGCLVKECEAGVGVRRNGCPWFHPGHGCILGKDSSCFLSIKGERVRWQICIGSGGRDGEG